LRSFEDILRQEPDHIPALYGKGLSLYHIGSYEEALSTFELYLQRNPQDEQARNYHRLAFESLGPLARLKRHMKQH